MPLKLWGRFCTSAVVHTSYFDCVMKATVWKVKVANMFAMLIIWIKIQKKFTADYNSFDKMNPIVGLISFLMNWVTYFKKPQKNLPKFCF